MLFTGSGVAIITPFDKNNKINYKKFNELLNFHIANNTDAIIVCGTTGESATLDTNEKKELIKFTVDKINHKIPVIAGTVQIILKHVLKCQNTHKMLDVMVFWL